MSTIMRTLIDLWLAVALHLWQTTLVLSLLFLLGRALRGAAAGVLYLLWGLAFAKLLLPTAVLGGGIQALLLMIRPQLASFHVTVGPLTVIAGLVDPVSRFGSFRGVVSPLGFSILVAWTLLWAAGSTRNVLHLARSLRQSGRIRLASPLGLTGPGRQRLLKAIQASSIPEDRVTLISDRVAPCVVGLIRPRILLPVALVQAMPLDELKGVLLHEETHRRRREPLRTAIIALGSAVYFFYPLLGILRRRLAQSAELVCDEKVMGHGIRPEVYARALSRTVRLALIPATPPRSLAAEKGTFLMTRLHRIRTLGTGPVRPRHVFVLSLALLLVVAASLLPAGLLTGCARESRVVTKEVPAAATQASTDSVPRDSRPDPGEGAGQSGLSSTAESSYDQAPVLISLPPPEYPQEAKTRGIEGVVQVRALVGAKGAVEQTLISKPADPLLDSAARAAVEKAKFRAALKGGRAEAVWVEIPIRFSLH